MPKLDRWLVASKMIEVIDRQTVKNILDLGGNIGGGWAQVHQHVYVNATNKEKIEQMLKDKGYTVIPADEITMFHPERETWRDKK